MRPDRLAGAAYHGGVTAQLGKYTILGELGAGASATVFLARDEELERMVALKQLASDLAGHPGFVDLFRHEAGVMARLDHPNCVRVYDLLEVGPALYIVSEYVEGSSLRRILEEAGKLEPEQAIGVTGGALRGLAHAHKLGLVHRDVKPENLLSDRAGISKLADFGQAFFTGEVSGGERQSSGSPAYMSPEQVRGDQGDIRSDVYAAGAVLYEFMAGRPPFIAISRLAVMKMHLERDPPELSRVNPRIPARVSSVVGQALNKEPQDRYQSAGEFLAALEDVAQEAYGRDWLLVASIAGLVATTAAGVTRVAAAVDTAGTTASGAAQVGASQVPAPEPAPPAPEPEPPAPKATVGPALVVSPPTRGGLVAGIIAAVVGLLIGAAIGYLNPQLASAPGPGPSSTPSLPAPGGGQPTISTVSARFDAALSTTFYRVNGGNPRATYTWGWVKNPGCGTLRADPGGLTAAYSHNGCSPVLEAGGNVGVCVTTPGGGALYQRNARFGDGALSAQEAADARVAGDQFSKVDASTATDFCSTRFASALAATVTPLPGAASPSPADTTPTAASRSPAAGSASSDSGQLPTLAAEAVVGLLIAGIGIRMLRRRVMP